MLRPTDSMLPRRDLSTKHIFRFVVILLVEAVTVEYTHVVVEDAVAIAVDESSEEHKAGITSCNIQTAYVVRAHLCEVAYCIREVYEIVLRWRDACLEREGVFELS